MRLIRSGGFDGYAHTGSDNRTSGHEISDMVAWQGVDHVHYQLIHALIAVGGREQAILPQAGGTRQRSVIR